MLVLGQYISYTGSVVEDVQFQRGRILASFYRNAGHKYARKLSAGARLKLVQTSELAIVRSVWARWPWTQARCQEIDRWQMELIKWIMRCHPLEGETADVFCHRKNAEAKKIAKAQDIWSHLFTRAVVNWADHVKRNHVNAWHGKLILKLTPLELQTLRLLHADCRPHTRKLPGGFPRRWCESVEDATTFCNKLPPPAKTSRGQHCKSEKEKIAPSVIVQAPFNGIVLTYPLGMEAHC